MQELEIRRTRVRREAVIYVYAVFFLGLELWFARATVGLWQQLAATPPGAPFADATVATSGVLVVTALFLLTLWLATPVWQLVLLHGRPEDVVARFDRGGLVLRDAGYTVAVPWSSVASLTIVVPRSGEPLVVPIVAGPVRSTHDPLARFVVRGLRKGMMKFGLGPDDPTPDEVRDGVTVLSEGRVLVP
jgi:hypothetical protein